MTTNRTKPDTNSRNQKRIVILGAGYAGLLATLRLAGKTKDRNVKITLINGIDTFVERIRLHQLSANQPLPRFKIAKFLTGTGVDFVQGWVTDIQPNAQHVTVQTPHGLESIAYDQLIYALGSTVDMHSVDGVADHAFALTDLKSSQQIGNALPELASRNGHLLIVGGAQYIRKNFHKLGIKLTEETTIERLDSMRAQSSDGTAIPFDLCLWAGAFSVPQVARQSGLTVNRQGQLIVDEQFRSISHPNVYAIGDSAATPLRMACATALPMGAYVADLLSDQLAGKSEAAPFRFGYAIRCISLGRNDGLIQMVYPDDSPKEQIIGGWLGARIKELVCRYTIWSLKLEKRIPGTYRWPKGRQLDGMLHHSDIVSEARS